MRGGWKHEVIYVHHHGKMADGKKLMQVMTLGIRQDQEVEIRVEGEDEEAAAAAIEQFLKENL